MAERSSGPLRILHVMRAPVGGLFRHVLDLSRGQAARGHQVGIVADSMTGGARADDALLNLSNLLAFGVSRVAMSRQIGGRDFGAVRHVAQRIADTKADVVHGHGAKGGAYARLATGAGAIRVYTPHGGSLHYAWSSPVGFVYLSLERILLRRSDLLLFESTYGRDIFRAKVGNPRCLVRVVHNGVATAEFEPVHVNPQAGDLVFVGELRLLKGVDVAIEAVALLAKEGRRVTLTIVGEGPDRAEFEAHAAALGIADAVTFRDALPAREAFALGHVVVVPSRAESLPYIVIEAAAAGRPLIATMVGGMAEIFGTDSDDLIPPGDPAALARAIVARLDEPERRDAAARRLQERVRARFSVDTMTEAVLEAYRDTLAARQG